MKTSVAVAPPAGTNSPTAVHAEVLMQLIPKSLPSPGRVGTVSCVQPAPFHVSTIGCAPASPPVPTALQSDTPTHDTEARMTSLKLFAVVVGVQVVPFQEAA